MFDWVTIGDSTIDAFHILDDAAFTVACSIDTERCQLCMTYADKIPVREMHKLVAGNAANNAVGVSRLGLRTAIYTTVGNDAAGQEIRAHFIAEGVATDYVQVSADQPTNLHTVLAFQGERTILVHHVPYRYQLPHMEMSRFVYLTSMANDWQPILPDLLNYIQSQHAKLIYQPGTFQLRAGQSINKEIIQQSYLVIMNKEEAQGLLGVEPTVSVRAILTQLKDWGAQIVVVTDGTRGSYATDGNNSFFLDVNKDIPRKESTGAGDAFASGVTVALSLGLSLTEGMRWGAVNAESVIQYIGPQRGLLNREQIQLELKKRPDFQPQIFA